MSLVRWALYHEDYDYKHQIPIYEFKEKEKIKIKERLGLEEDEECEKWRKDKSAPDDVGCFDTTMERKTKVSFS